LKNIFQSMYQKAANYNRKNIVSLLEMDADASYLDLGCNTGSFTLTMAKKIHTTNILGVELIDEIAHQARSRNIGVETFDLNETFPFHDNTFDVITANQVIEHLSSIDTFVAEIFRILKPNGYAVISTENGSSWHNIFASTMGWQIFSLTNFSKLGSIGNPLSLWDKKNIEPGAFHVYIFNIYGLKEYFKKCGFQIEKILGAGYYPLPPWFGNIDITHAAFVSYKIRK
jgi:ubiquinone/menaquinone biosynthesis C-methylase UbiE